MNISTAIEYSNVSHKVYGPTLLDSVLYGLFGKQMEFVLDDAMFKAAHPGRRSGKTHMVSRYIVCCALQFNKAIIPYIALTKDHARRLLWPLLKELNEQYQIGIEFNESLLRATLPNGCKIWLTGADKKDEIEKLRGDKYPYVFIDEIGSMQGLIQYLVEDVLKFALLDYRGAGAGKIIVTGTPPPNAYGYFVDICKGDTKRKWSVHHWTLRDNSAFPVWADSDDWQADCDDFIAEEMKLEGWSDDNPTKLRELDGLFVHDPSMLVYKFNSDKNITDESDIKKSNDLCVIGMDLGSAALTTWTVWRFNPQSHGNFVQVHEHGESGLSISEIGSITRKLNEEYRPISIACDPGALGDMIIDDIAARFNVPIEAAQKNKKLDHIEVFNSDMFEGRIKALKGSALVKEWLEHSWEWDHDAPKHKPKKLKEADTPNHYADSALYAWRRAFHWIHKPGEPEPEYGTAEHADYQADKLYQQRLDNISNSKDKPWWK